ncbi:MAG: 2-succinyl-6-hydroxy-2,4-cyclohexadiene-1-carboxylate synthase [Ignavibacteriales bacterium]|nr:2-succinyl-6-hydroxy-2,4-cyclohexadiene-1-carboxylate synthase [Ignavibacteriales bacterium]
MQIRIDDLEFNLLIDESELASKKTHVLFLHGFTGCAEDWKFIFDKLPPRFCPVAIDLIGHGKSSKTDNPEYYSTDSHVYQLNAIIKKLKLSKIILCGYSMGGRVALSFAVKYPKKISALILESASPGIEDFNSKKERVEFDLLLADKIRKEGIESFMEFWFNMPIFESLKEIPNYDEIKNNRAQNDVIGLSNSLSGFSTGLMPSYWKKLDKLKFPALLISGSNDIKYTTTNSRMRTLIKNSRHEIIENCGHNTHLEKPELFTNFVREFLSSNF